MRMDLYEVKHLTFAGQCPYLAAQRVVWWPCAVKHQISYSETSGVSSNTDETCEDCPDDFTARALSESLTALGLRYEAVSMSRATLIINIFCSVFFVFNFVKVNNHSFSIYGASWSRAVIGRNGNIEKHKAELFLALCQRGCPRRSELESVLINLETSQMY